MADKEIGVLPAATSPLAGTEQVHVVEGANSRRTTVQDIADLGFTRVIETESGTTYTQVAADNLKYLSLIHI